ncbi:hypothetical protein [Bradyrhizobium erythrophlei]|uniref:hypothetical protein n=1 Tax=Bradyrhizobium erythrophlei TaxID=1437360 RepID=UPI000B8718F7|nr:hypothetical protein [Bradyrhizobium erythrophlei]
MIKDVMVRLDGGFSDEIQLAAGAEIARQLESHLVVGQFLNPLPLPGAVEGDLTAEIIDHSRTTGDQIEAALVKQLQLLDGPVEIGRFDVVAEILPRLQPARPVRQIRSWRYVPMVRWIPIGWSRAFFGSGRHLPLVPETERPKIATGFSSPGTAAANPPAPWCRFCTRPRR